VLDKILAGAIFCTTGSGDTSCSCSLSWEFVDEVRCGVTLRWVVRRSARSHPSAWRPAQRSGDESAEFVSVRDPSPIRRPSSHQSRRCRTSHVHRQSRTGTSREVGDLRMAHQDDIALMAHLMRRAGFGAGRDELEARVAKGYEATVEELLHPET